MASVQEYNTYDATNSTNQSFAGAGAEPMSRLYPILYAMADTITLW